MSDEYSGRQLGNTLVDQSARDTVPNYPTDDSTSSGGSGSRLDAWSTKAQRGAYDPSNPSPYVSGTTTPVVENSGYNTPNTGLIDQSTSGGNLKTAVLGTQYVGDSWESKEEAERMLAERSTGK